MSGHATEKGLQRAKGASRSPLKLLTASVVVLAQEHNPTILHPAFLASQKIVPDDWAVAEPPICTPAVSIAKYQNGLVFTVDSNKLQVIDNDPRDELSSSLAPMLAGAYVSTLPHVAYTAVGVNFSAILPRADASAYIMRRFLALGPWMSKPDIPSECGIRLLYRSPIGTLRFSVNPGQVTQTQRKAIEGVLVEANYHADITGSQRPDQIVAVLGRFAELTAHFFETLNTLLEVQR